MPTPKRDPGPHGVTPTRCHTPTASHRSDSPQPPPGKGRRHTKSTSKHPPGDDGSGINEPCGPLVKAKGKSSAWSRVRQQLQPHSVLCHGNSPSPPAPLALKEQQILPQGFARAWPPPSGSTHHPLVSPARAPTCSSLSEYFCGFLLPWLFLRSFFSSAWHLSRESPLLLCSVWYFFSAAWMPQEKVLSLGCSSCCQGVTETSRAPGNSSGIPEAQRANRGQLSCV